MVRRGLRRAILNTASRGVAMVEFALVLPLLILFFSIIADFGLFARDYHLVTQYARELAIKASTVPCLKIGAPDSPGIVPYTVEDFEDTELISEDVNERNMYMAEVRQCLYELYRVDIPNLCARISTDDHVVFGNTLALSRCPTLVIHWWSRMLLETEPLRLTANPVFTHEFGPSPLNASLCQVRVRIDARYRSFLGSLLVDFPYSGEAFAGYAAVAGGIPPGGITEDADYAC